MKIAFDIDKTYTTDPEFFNSLASHLKLWGHEVGIVTLREEGDLPIETESVDWNFKIHISDEELSQILKNGEISEERVVNIWKSSVCNKENIDILFDDKANHLDSPRTKAVVVRG